MSNHGHLILTPHSEGALSALMKGVLQRYAQQRNREKGCSGKLFEQRFWSTPIVESGHLAATTAYVELNPERAGLGSSKRCRWTTYRLHAGQGDATFARVWTPSAWYLGLGSNREARARAYRARVEQASGSACVAPDVIRDPPVPAGAPRVERPDRSGAR